MLSDFFSRRFNSFISGRAENSSRESQKPNDFFIVVDEWQFIVLVLFVWSVRERWWLWHLSYCLFMKSCFPVETANYRSSKQTLYGVRKAAALHRRLWDLSVCEWSKNMSLKVSRAIYSHSLITQLVHRARVSTSTAPDIDDQTRKSFHACHGKATNQDSFISTIEFFVISAFKSIYF